MKSAQFPEILAGFFEMDFPAKIEGTGGYQKRWDYFAIEKNLKKNRKNLRAKSKRYSVHFQDIGGDQKTLVSKIFGQLFQKNSKFF